MTTKGGHLCPEYL